MTTLVPTFLHLVAGLGGVFLAWRPDARRLAAQIPYAPGQPEQEELSEVRKDEIVTAIRRVRYWYLPAALFILIGFVALLWLFSSYVEPFGQFLANAAYCSTSWTGHGKCGWW